MQQQIDALRGKGPSEAQKINDQALSDALATARAQLEQAAAQTTQLNARLSAQRQTRAGLVPLLDHMLTLLEQSIRADLPFETQRRLGAVERARKGLSDASLSATQRLEHVLEIYHQELRLNHTTQVTQAVLDTDDGARSVRLLRVGRIALYAVSDDLRSCAVYRIEQRLWSNYAQGICRQLDALGARLEQAPLDGLPLSVPTPP